MLAADSRYENPKMSQLERVLLNQFGPDVESRGILFSKTRKSTHCLHDWVSTSTALKGAGIKAAILTGAGNGIDHMSHVCSETLHMQNPECIRVCWSHSVSSFLPARAEGHHPQFSSGAS